MVSKSFFTFLVLILLILAILENTNNNTSHSWLGLVIVSTDRWTYINIIIITYMHAVSLCYVLYNTSVATEKKDKGKSMYCLSSMLIIVVFFLCVHIYKNYECVVEIQ